VLSLAAVCVAGVTAGGVQYARVSSQAAVAAHASKLAEGVTATEAYQQGGSVYAEQVPREAVASDQSAFAAGGSVYTEQVPSAATDRSAYGPGGSVYTEQVPSVR